MAKSEIYHIKNIPDHIQQSIQDVMLKLDVFMAYLESQYEWNVVHTAFLNSWLKLMVLSFPKEEWVDVLDKDYHVLLRNIKHLMENPEEYEEEL